MPYLRLVSIMIGVLGLPVTAIASDCLIGTSVVSQRTSHFVESVVWRLQATDATPGIDPSAELKSEALLKKLFELMNKDATHKLPGFLLSQEDLGALSEFVQVEGYDFNDLLQAKARLEREGDSGRFKPALVKSEALRFISDLAWVRGRMDEYELWNSEAARSPEESEPGTKLQCRFAYGQSMKATILDQSANPVWSENGLNSADPRMIIGQCRWNKRSRRLISEPPERPALQELRESE